MVPSCRRGFPMTRSRRVFGVWAIAAAGLLAGGCFQHTGTLPKSTDRPFVLQSLEEDLENRTARSQQPEPEKPEPLKPVTQTSAGLPAPPPRATQNNLA